jgi:hypothetical protein
MKQSSEIRPDGSRPIIETDPEKMWILDLARVRSPLLLLALLLWLTRRPNSPDMPYFVLKI